MGGPDISHYTLLGVGRDASPNQIRTAYLKMSLSLHPDKNEFGAELMKEINEAYDILSDDAKRRQYDRNLRDGSGRLERELKKVKEELKEARLETEELKNREQPLRTELVELRKQVSHLETENRGLQLSLDEAQNELIDQIDSNAKEYRAREALKKELKESRLEVKEFKSREEALQSNYDGALARACVLKKLNETLQSDSQNARGEVTLLKTKLLKKEKENDSLQRRLTRSQNRAQTAWESKERWIARLKEVRSCHDSSLKRSRELRQIYRSTREELWALRLLCTKQELQKRMAEVDEKRAKTSMRIARDRAREEHEDVKREFRVQLDEAMKAEKKRAKAELHFVIFCCCIYWMMVLWFMSM